MWLQFLSLSLWISCLPHALQFSGFTVPAALHTVGCIQSKFSGENSGIAKVQVVSAPRDWCGLLQGHPVVAVDIGLNYAGKVIVLQSITCLDSR